MLNYVRQFFKIRVVFYTLYLWNEVGDPNFFCISDTSNSSSDCMRSKNVKKSIDWKIFARTSLTYLRFAGMNYTGKVVWTVQITKLSSEIWSVSERLISVLRCQFRTNQARKTSNDIGVSLVSKIMGWSRYCVHSKMTPSTKQNNLWFEDLFISLSYYVYGFFASSGKNTIIFILKSYVFTFFCLNVERWLP